MIVCKHNGLRVAVLTRDEHCPPHVHVDGMSWNARFVFSFWNNGVSLWDVTPAKNQPNARQLEELRKSLKETETLKKMRIIWWECHQTTCLENKRWDMKLNKVSDLKNDKSDIYFIESAIFYSTTYTTKIKLKNHETLEIEL